MLARLTILVSALVIVPSGCSPNGDFQILDKDEGRDEWEQRRRQMNVTVFREDPNGGIQQLEMEPHEVGGLLFQRCEDEENPESPLGQCPQMEGPEDPPTSCFGAVCQMHLFMCVAHGLLELAHGLTTQEFEQDEDQVVYTYKIPPQDAASNAGLTEMAVTAGRLALTRAGESLRAAAGRQASFQVCTGPNDLYGTVYPPDVKYGDYLANGFVEAFHLVREATESARQANVAAADAAFSEVRSAGKANRTAWVAPILSRAAAAHDLVGGEDGLAGFDDTGVCPGPTLTPTTAAAVGLIETVAPDPVVVENLTITVDELLVDEMTVSTGPIVQRYADLYGFDAMADLDADEFLNIVGLTREDFSAARQYLAGRSKAFARSQTVKLSRWTKPGGYEGSYDVFAATARPPTPPPRSYYGVLARRTSTPVVDSTSGNPTIPSVQYAERGFAQTLDYAASVAFDLVGTSLPDNVRRSLSLVATDGGRQRESRMQLCYARAQGMHNVMVRLYGYDGSENVEIVEGVDGLSCAVRGHVEGADCDLADYLVSASSSSQTATPATGFDEYLQLDFSPDWTENTDIYLVRRQPHLNDDVAGSFAEIVGTTVIVYQNDTSWWEYCTDTPVAPEVEEEVASVLMASTADCSLPADPCADVDFDKIPLEDELSSEGDGAYEQSWRHYLTLARLAADEADALGEQVIANGLQMDMRAEQAIDELEDICGGSINIDALISPELDDAIDPTDCSMTACPDGYACQGGTTCVLDPLAMARERAPTSADDQRLSDCLGDDVIERFVTLGSQPVCIWHDTDNENRICADAEPGQQCPYISYDGTCDSTRSPPGKMDVLIEMNLGFFDNDGGTRVGANPPCDRLRQLRNSNRTMVEHAWDMAHLETTDFFDPSNVRAYASRLSWEARPGEYSAVMLDGADWITTGDMFSGTNVTKWPCADPDPMEFPGCAADEHGLFCEQYSCTDADQRRTLNYRLAGAVLAARMTAGLGLEPVRFPVTRGGTATFETAADETALSTTLRSGSLTKWQGGSVTAHFSGTTLPTAFCSVPAVTLWRPLDDSGVAPTCSSEGSSSAFWVRGGGAARGDALAISGSLWSGLGNRHWYYYSHPAIGPFFRRVLQSSDRFAGTTVYLGPSTPGIGDLTDYWDNDGGPYGGISSPSQPLSDGLTALEMLDAMELICEAARGGGWHCDDSPPRIASPADLDSARQYMHCVASSIERAGELTVFANVPSQAVEALGRTSGTGAYPGLGGEYGAQISSLRAGFVELASVPRLIGSELRHMSNDIDRLRLALARLETRREMANVEFLSSVSNQLAACAGAAGGVVAGNFGGAATCANSVAQINFAAQLNELAESDLDLAGEESLLDFRDRFESRATTLADLSGRLVEAAEQVDGALARLESLRRRGRRSLSKALFLDSEPGGRHLNVNTVMRRRMNTDQKRYERAHRHAIKMAYLAKMAVEQRLGMRLAELTDEMSLVEAPSTWESTLCSSSGIDYHRIRTAGLIEDDDYSDAYIGEYVRKLERVVESYRLDFPFQNGSDTSVISIRDEIHNVRGECEVEVHNLLVHTDSMVIADSATTEPGWRITGCAEPPPGDTVMDCVGVTLLTGLSDGPFTVPHADLAAPRAHRIQFGPSSACGDPCDAMVTPDAVLEQSIDLGPGRYRLSWYGRAVGMDLPPDEALSVVFADPDNGSVGATLELMGSGGEWNRYYSFITLTTAQTVRVVVSAEIPGTPLPGYVGPAVDLAGVMLEDVTEYVVGVEDSDEMVGPGEYAAADFPPREFVGTADSPTRNLAVCEDTTGEAFRPGWTRGCLRLCAAGYGRECPGDAEAVRFCYWETEFAITQRDIERGRLIHSGGFARGNYNYRIDTLALNFVGSAARQCADERLASTCYSAAYIPYSLDHIGRYTVRNHRGEDYEAPLFQGHIEHGRGLAAERYITNPISSADRGLIEPYMHREFRGRPIDGVYRLRVWEEPGVNFEGIEDVQVVLNYRYWTRFE